MDIWTGAVGFEVCMVNCTARDGPDSTTCMIPRPAFRMLDKPNSPRFLIRNQSIILAAGER